MSKMCIGILIDSSLGTEQLCKQIEQQLGAYGFAAFYELPYNESFFASYINKNPFVFSIADTDKHDNCEMFLLPDNCLLNGQRNTIPFIERMVVLQNVLMKLITNTSKIELFIGDSGTRLCDFERYDINVSEFLHISNQLNSINSADLHIIIRGEDKGTRGRFA